MKKHEDIDNFADAVAGADPNLLLRDQKSLVRDFNNGTLPGQQGGGSTITKDENGSINDGVDEGSFIGQSERDGEKFEVKVKSVSPKDKKEKEWLEREMMVTFTSLEDRGKVVASTLSSLCGGRFANLSSLPAGEVAEALSRECDMVFTYADASMAVYSDSIDAQQAFRIARSVSEKNIISSADYEKIKSKLSPYFEREFENLLATAKLKIAYPISSVLPASKNNTSEYFVDYLRDTKEYKMGNMFGLRIRIASVLNSVDEGMRQELLSKFKEDQLLKNF
jgi:hypothetical protein